MGTGHRHVALTVGSRALGAFEPRQVRKEAALRTPPRCRGTARPEQAAATPPGAASFEGGMRGRAWVLRFARIT